MEIAMNDDLDRFGGAGAETSADYLRRISATHPRIIPPDVRDRLIEAEQRRRIRVVLLFCFTVTSVAVSLCGLLAYVLYRDVVMSWLIWAIGLFMMVIVVAASAPAKKAKP